MNVGSQASSTQQQGMLMRICTLSLSSELAKPEMRADELGFQLFNSVGAEVLGVHILHLAAQFVCPEECYEMRDT